MARGINFLSFSFMIEGDIMLVGMKELKIEKANVLMVYDNVLKSPDPYILNSIRKNYREEFKDFMDLDLLDSLGDYESLFYLTMCRTKKNPLEWMAKKPFDYDKFYNKMKKKSKTLYYDSKPLFQYKAFKSFSRAYLIDQIYVWNPYYDKRQHFDINEILKDRSNVQYCVSENLVDTIDRIGDLNIVYDWDLDRIAPIIKSGNYPEIFFAIAGFGFNKNEDGSLKEGLNEYENVGVFPTIERPDRDLFVG